MAKTIRVFLANQSGATAIQYALIASSHRRLYHRRSVGARHEFVE